MFINNFDPVALEIFSLEIRWYSLAYIFGIILGWILAKKLFIQDIEVKNKFDDYLTYLIIGIILGGRLGYIFIYNLSFYINNPLDIFKIWQGGMSFHGGLIGVIFASIFFAKKNNQTPFFYLDIDFFCLFFFLEQFFRRFSICSKGAGLKRCRCMVQGNLRPAPRGLIKKLFCRYSIKPKFLTDSLKAM